MKALKPGTVLKVPLHKNVAKFSPLRLRLPIWSHCVTTRTRFKPEKESVCVTLISSNFLVT